MPKPMPIHPLILVGDTPDVLARAIDDGVSAAACYKMKIPPRLSAKLAASFDPLEKIARKIPRINHRYVNMINSPDALYVYKTADSDSLNMIIGRDKWDGFQSICLSTESKLQPLIARINVLDGAIETTTRRDIINREIRVEFIGNGRLTKKHKDGDGGIKDRERLLWVIDGDTSEGFINPSIQDVISADYDYNSVGDGDCFSFPEDSVIWVGTHKRGLWHRSPPAKRRRLLYIAALGPRR